MRMLTGTAYTDLLSDLSSAEVIEMSDGGMGSLRFSPFQHRIFGSEIAQLQFNDLDGVPVSATVNLDDHGRLLELDIFKSDFSPLLSFPSTS